MPGDSGEGLDHKAVFQESFNGLALHLASTMKAVSEWRIELEKHQDSESMLWDMAFLSGILTAMHGSLEHLTVFLLDVMGFNIASELEIKLGGDDDDSTEAPER